MESDPEGVELMRSLFLFYEESDIVQFFGDELIYIKREKNEKPTTDPIGTHPA